MARSLLVMVAQASCLLVKECAKAAGCLDRVFVVGGFMEVCCHPKVKIQMETPKARP